MNAPMPYAELASAGAFTTGQVARLIGATTHEVSSWLRGEEPIIRSDYEPIERHRLLSFEGLLEARVVAYLVRHGFKIRRLRSLMRALRERTSERHPLARRDTISTTGDRVFERDGEQFVNLVNDCYAPAELLAPALRGFVAYEGAKALYLQPDPKVLPMIRIDPRKAFGRPVVVDGPVAVPTEVLAGAERLEGVNGAADWYGVSPEAVRQAVEFEKSVAA